MGYDSTAVTSALLGCFKVDKSKLSFDAVKDVSMSRSCALREISMGAERICFLSCKLLVQHPSRRNEDTHAESCDEALKMPSLLIYSVFRNHGTCASGVEAPFPPPAFAVIPVVLDGSDNRNASFGSSLGKFEGSGFNAALHDNKGRSKLTSK